MTQSVVKLHGSATQVRRFDNKYSETQRDEATGVRIWVIAQLFLDGLDWIALKCSSWVWINRGTSKRTKDNWEGDESRPGVLEANRSTVRVCIILLLGDALGNKQSLEQPISSSLEDVPHLAAAFQVLGCDKMTTPLGAFGADSVKYVKFWYNWNDMHKLKRKKPVMQNPASLATKVGMSVTGIPSNLEASAAYPAEFGLHAAHLVVAHVASS